ncbi:MAG TPA: hypothetical protein VKT81_20550 [Bryobacteraceae bacterium]|nr:hypothetical protein [Bryobacteraceae bacterium]
MTIFDLLFLALLALAAVTAAIAVATALRGQGRKAIGILRNLTIAAVLYVGIVYAVTAFSKRQILQVGDPECDDDWCLAVEHVRKSPQGALAIYDIDLRIFSRALRVAQREKVARDVYLVDASWKRYDPSPAPDEVPLSVLLQPGESIPTHRRFQVPTSATSLSLKIDRSSILPFCVIIGECEAFHQGILVRLGDVSAN